MPRVLSSDTESTFRSNPHAELGGGLYTLALGEKLVPNKGKTKKVTRYVQNARRIEAIARELQSVEPNAQTLAQMDDEKKAHDVQEIRKIRAQLSQVGVPNVVVASEVAIEPLQQTLPFPEPEHISKS